MTPSNLLREIADAMDRDGEWWLEFQRCDFLSPRWHKIQSKEDAAATVLRILLGEILDVRRIRRVRQRSAAEAAVKAKEMIPILNQWRDDMIEVDMHMRDLARVTGMSPDSLLWTAVSGTQERLTRATEHIVGDTCQWMSWFWLENDMGRKGMDAGPADDMRPIRTIDDLAWLITDDRSGVVVR